MKRAMITKYGKEARNQFTLTHDNGTTIMFYSYDQLIAINDNGTVYLNTALWHYSRTTDYYRGQFLGENTAATRKKLKSGEYKAITQDILQRLNLKLRF